MEPATATLISAVLKKPVEDIFSAIGSGIKSISKKWDVAGLADSVCQSIEDLERVRTIFAGEPVPLSSFYYPSKVQIGNSQRNLQNIESLADLSEKSNLLILGTVGQGKSMFMRYLCVKEARKGRRIPVFIELRGIDSKCTLAQLLIKALQSIGFVDLDESGLDFLCSTGKIVIFADGFDELKREFSLSVQQDLGAAMAKYPYTQWIISSRPGSLAGHLETLPKLARVRLSPLQEEDFLPFLERLGVDEAMRAKLVDSVKKSRAEVKGVLTTPLMLTLLVETFGRSAAVPNNLHDFYISLFNVLAWRHDDLKPLFKRERATNLTNTELQDAFEAFCFLSKEVGVSLSDEQFAQVAKNAARVVKKEFVSEGFKNDLTDAVCLMMRDGLKTAFIHKSIQEFFASFFVKHNVDERVTRKIYESIRGQKLINWSQELVFLSKIDEFRFQEYFRIPAIEQLTSKLGFLAARKISPSKKTIHDFFANLHAHCVQFNNQSDRKITYLLLENDRDDFTCGVLELVSALRPVFVPVFLPISELQLVTHSRRGTVATLAQYCRQNKDQETAFIARVREVLTKLDRERLRQQRVVAEHKSDLSRIILGEF
ncbi:conserved protein of unknown function (plasmid) [Cupriavidus taiwanensis]|uniref:NACHT domain-containing protein n=1 Tax=Cupriavidus taiwanensis TaxID=164546 RepID=A0A375EES5_9BURK|nr:NACHT domain-containing protein [Cupriavidus taiwanensis]SOZ71223.1 conserved protein of unknown function [Cupriavidus taiwanensis]SOZ72291.1 conserved protein of unknown function [Cupriavidus taiwanensis]SOZ74580.1 conserved protein of unknown function [Cupriavidus taiwanensis]SPA03498.1 conserved protein of unknown function [Cupriavidus taiwanensis]SPA12632.1 conserved hypothetical protein [Cupriavidus taiwanensis]